MGALKRQPLVDQQPASTSVRVVLGEKPVEQLLASAKSAARRSARYPGNERERWYSVTNRQKRFCVASFGL
jgi:hypothetical protein